MIRAVLTTPVESFISSAAINHVLRAFPVPQMPGSAVSSRLMTSLSVLTPVIMAVAVGAESGTWKSVLYVLERAV